MPLAPPHLTTEIPESAPVCYLQFRIRPYNSRWQNTWRCRSLFESWHILPEKRDYFLAGIKGSSFLNPWNVTGRTFSHCRTRQFQICPTCRWQKVNQKHKVASVPVSAFYQDKTDNKLLILLCQTGSNTWSGDRNPSNSDHNYFKTLGSLPFFAGKPLLHAWFDHHLVQSDLYWEKSMQICRPLKKDLADRPRYRCDCASGNFTTGFYDERTKTGRAWTCAHSSGCARWPTRPVRWSSGFIAKVHDKHNRLLWMEPVEILRRTISVIYSAWRMNTRPILRVSLLVGEWKGWRICPLICRLRFPVWSRNTYDAISKRLNYDLLIYVANWPTARVGSVECIAEGAPIENLSYVVGVNRVGVDGNSIEYNGNSAMIGPKGEVIFTSRGIETIKTLELNANSVAGVPRQVSRIFRCRWFRLRMKNSKRAIWPVWANYFSNARSKSTQHR